MEKHGPDWALEGGRERFKHDTYDWLKKVFYFFLTQIIWDIKEKRKDRLEKHSIELQIKRLLNMISYSIPCE